jgi:hypothetical protein
MTETAKQKLIKWYAPVDESFVEFGAAEPPNPEEFFQVYEASDADLLIGGLEIALALEQSETKKLAVIIEGAFGQIRSLQKQLEAAMEVGSAMMAREIARQKEGL